MSEFARPRSLVWSRADFMEEIRETFLEVAPSEAELKVFFDQWLEVEISRAEKTFLLASPSSPINVRIDPEHQLLLCHLDAEYGPRT